SQLRQPIELIFSPAIKKRDVVALYVAGLAKTLAKPAQTVPHRVGQPCVEEANHRHRRLLRARRERPRSCRPAKRGQEFPSSDVPRHMTLRWGSFMQWKNDTTLPSRGQ